MTLGGAYVLLEKIGTGGMGAVYRAEQRALRRTVAVKTIHAHLLHDPAFAERFITEARAASRLSHPNVVSVIDFGKTGDGLPYLVMEYLRGRDLRTVLQEVGLLCISRVVAILQQILGALAEAHEQGIVHRDLKPANIVLEPTRSGGDFVKVVDFGLAKVLHGSAERALATGGLVRGTPTYMAPEQAEGGVIDARSDIYALGVTLFELLTGTPPFKAENPTSLMLKHVSEAPPDPRTVSGARDIPAALADIALRALAKDPDDRFQTADDFSRALSASDSVEEFAHPTIPVPGRAASCPTCGEPLTASQKFCGGCGGRVSAAGHPSALLNPESTAPQSHLRMGSRAPRVESCLEGAEEHLAWLRDLRLRHQKGVSAARLVGSHGSGRTTLLQAFIASARGQGDAVASIGPDPWWAEPAYHALRNVILQLVRLPEYGKDPLGWAGANAEARVGLQSIFLGVADDHPDTSNTYRRSAFAALRWALDRAAQGAATGRVVVAIDDLERIDGASRNAFGDAVLDPNGGLWLVVAVHATHFRSTMFDAPERMIHGMPTERARAMVQAVGADASMLDAQGRWVSPLLAEQAIRAHLEGVSAGPCGAEDLVRLRIAALPPSARSVLDALCVLGEDVSIQDLTGIVDYDCDVDEGLLALAVGGFVDRGASGLCWLNPVFREVARSALPAALRRVLFNRAAELLGERGAPLEARASYALEAGRGLEALFLLECVARTARLRGDQEGAIRALQRGYAFARQHCDAECDAEIEEPDRAIVVFGRKLGEALLDAGRLPEAEMTLREVLTVADASNSLEVLRALAKVAHAESRGDDAGSFSEEAITKVDRPNGMMHTLDPPSSRSAG